MTQTDCLIVDDEPDIRELLEITLSRMGISTLSCGTLTEAHHLLSKHQFNLCLSDMRLPDGDGIELVEYINDKFPDMPVAMITAHGNMESAIRALKAGAFDFISKPVDLGMLRQLVGAALKLSNQDNVSDNTHSVPSNSAPTLFGSSEPIQAIRAMTSKLARNQAPVHISGESGTGKELAARMIHQQGPRNEYPFIAVNCGAVPQELMESEFFGHIKGSFTGAFADKQGLFQAAHQGTLFLDEVADLPLSMQVKLLRAIQEKSIRPVGGTCEIDIDVRIISATHKDLHQLVEEGHFRKDLYYRINVIELNLPALREHCEDLPGMIDFFLEKISQRNAIEKPEIEPDALKQLTQYHYPGNVRELENILEGAIALHENNKITSTDLKLNRRNKPGPTAGTKVDSTKNLEEQLEQFEKQLIADALLQNQWNRNATADQLGINTRQLRYKMEKLELDTRDEDLL